MSKVTSKFRFYLFWTLRLLMVALFLFASVMKLSAQPMMVAEFDQIGVGQWFRYVTGILELVGALGLLIPKRIVAAALLLLLIVTGAFVAQIAILHMDWIHPIIIAAVLVGILLLERSTKPLRGMGKNSIPTS